MAKSRRSPNNFLASLSSSDFKFLHPHLKLIELQHETVLFETGANVKNVYFPHSGIISLVVPLKRWANDRSRHDRPRQPRGGLVRA